MSGECDESRLIACPWAFSEARSGGCICKGLSVTNTAVNICSCFPNHPASTTTGHCPRHGFVAVGQTWSTSRGRV